MKENYIQNQFVTYEIALKLKELGFNKKCLGFYFDKEFELYESYDSVKYRYNNGIKAPLWQQVIDFLETKGYYINITRVFRWSPLPIKFSGWCIYIGTDNPEESLECNSYYVDHYYSTKQEAREQAILKAIELCQK